VATGEGCEQPQHAELRLQRVRADAEFGVRETQSGGQLGAVEEGFAEVRDAQGALGEQGRLGVHRPVGVAVVGPEGCNARVARSMPNRVSRPRLTPTQRQRFY